MTGPTLTKFCNILNKECVKQRNTACKRQPDQQNRTIHSKRKLSKKCAVGLSKFIEDSDENDKQDNESDLESRSQSENEADCKLEDDMVEINKEVSAETCSENNQFEI